MNLDALACGGLSGMAHAELCWPHLGASYRLTLLTALNRDVLERLTTIGGGLPPHGPRFHSGKK